jgi:hypothetical protein
MGRWGLSGHRETCCSLPAAGPYLRLNRFLISVLSNLISPWISFSCSSFCLSISERDTTDSFWTNRYSRTCGGHSTPTVMKPNASQRNDNQKCKCLVAHVHPEFNFAGTKIGIIIDIGLKQKHDTFPRI